MDAGCRSIWQRLMRPLLDPDGRQGLLPHIFHRHPRISRAGVHAIFVSYCRIRITANDVQLVCQVVNADSESPTPPLRLVIGRCIQRNVAIIEHIGTVLRLKLHL